MSAHDLTFGLICSVGAAAASLFAYTLIEQLPVLSAWLEEKSKVYADPRESL